MFKIFHLSQNVIYRLFGEVGGTAIQGPRIQSRIVRAFACKFPQSPIIQNDLIRCSLFFVLGDIDSLHELRPVVL